MRGGGVGVGVRVTVFLTFLIFGFTPVSSSFHFII